MKILYVGYLREVAGYSEATRTDIKALAQKYDVVCRSLNISANYKDDYIEFLSSKSLDGVTHVIQHCLPHDWEFFPNTKNIGYFETESLDLSNSYWPEYFNKVDCVCVPNSEGLDQVKRLGAKCAQLLPHFIDSSVYDANYSLFNIPYIKGDYVFYTIGTPIKRKNLESIIAAYYSEFDPTEPASLVIKTSTNIDPIIESVQKSLNIYSNRENYKKIITITKSLSRAQIYGLHQSCDCYINASSGESWCLPLVDAVGFENSVITLNEGGPKDIVGKNRQENGIGLLDYVTTWCNPHTSFPNFQDGRDSWKICDFNQLKSLMRFFYENKTKTSRSILDSTNYSYFEKVLEL